MNSVFIEAESLKNKGGWIVDTLSMESIRSAYLMAHGMGVPVEDARGTFSLSCDGDYRVWALTRDWTAEWNVSESAGRFEIRIDGAPLPSELGTNGKDWLWQLAGEIFLGAGEHTLALHDLTGFNGRCDAVYITDSTDAPSNESKAIEEMRKDLNWKKIRTEDEIYDLVVVGGGIAGICTAIAAKQSGVRVALVHDREILGGCNSSEVRVCMGGMINLPPYPNLGNVVKAIAPIVGYPSTYRKEYFEDDRKRFAFEITEGVSASHRLYLGEAVTDVEYEDGVISAVICTNTQTGAKTRIRGKLFSDCSGDGIVARKTGCETMYGREARDEFGESLAPKMREHLVMGHSIRWCSEERTDAVPFPDIDWGLHFSDESCLNCTSGDWEQETGFTRDMVKDAEYIRDYGLRAIYSNWAYQKHHFKDKKKFEKLALLWVSPIGGKREAYRVKGDHILTQQDLEEQPIYEDATACVTWSIDMHFPDPVNKEEFGEAFRSFAYHRGFTTPYPMPYRCLYSKDVKNLFIGGRLVSSTHVAFSAVRVMRTLGELGEVVGMASSICKKYGCTPRAVYTEHLDELRELLCKGITIPDAFNCGIAGNEFYHFKDIGWWWLNFGSADYPEQVEKFNKSIGSLGIEHKYPTPEKWKKR